MNPRDDSARRLPARSAGPREWSVPLDLGGARAWFTTRGAADASGHSATASVGEFAGDFASRDLGLHVGDDPRAVRANRADLDAAIGARAWYVDQVHGTDVLRVTAPPAPGTASGGEADAIVLDARGSDVPLAAAIMVADCSPVLLASADGLLAAAVHVGRAGLLAGVLEAAIDALLCLEPGLAEPGALVAALGPGICGACYEVSPAIHAGVTARVPAAATRTRWGTPGADVGAGVRAVLARAAGIPGGVGLDESAARCTYEAADLFSYRRATHDVAARRAAGEAVGYDGPARTGRFAGVVRTAAL